jgi:hypothetical protein
LAENEMESMLNLSEEVYRGGVIVAYPEELLARHRIEVVIEEAVEVVLVRLKSE